ncbi:MFS transporter [Rhodococcus sp. H36-A4]|uniref:MFS transporter n=1 Tax=Rhodococcus sp. H36-A4 TaxID=3004353 RepID=UPI0022AFCD14|nr:MFS transporter [Rhodococcus sp. H36-A4]MCZ4077197.1 MFS transporter [Rhodococcus sp. H36-A4]
MLTVSCMAVALVVSAMAALNTALGDIARDTGATQAQLTWIVDGYTLTLACLLLPAGALGDRYGRRRMLVLGLLLFGAASTMPILVDSPEWLIATRGAAGVGAALVMPATLALITAEFDPHTRSRAVGIWAGVAGSGAVAGLLTSGLLLELWSWHSIFFALALVSVVVTVLACTLRPSSAPMADPFDVPGAVLIAAAVALFVFGVIEGPARGWLHPLVLIGLVAGLAAAGAFAVVESRRFHPLLDVRLFRGRAFAVGSVSLLLQFLATFGLFFLIVQYLQLVLDYSPLQSAVALAPIAAPVLVLSVLSPWLLRLVGLRVLTAAGLTVLSASLFLLTRLGIDSDYIDVAVPLVISAIGIGLCTAPATSAIVSNTPEDKQGVASAVNDAAREIGAAIGVALAGSVLAVGYSRSIEPTAAMAPPEAQQAIGDSLASSLAVAEMAGPQGTRLETLAREAFVSGMHEASIALGVVLIFAAVLTAAWAPSRKAERILV